MKIHECSMAFSVPVLDQGAFMAFSDMLKDIISIKKVDLLLKMYTPLTLLQMTTDDLTGIGLTQLETKRFNAIRKLSTLSVSPATNIACPLDAAEIMQPYFDKQEKEYLGILMLDRRSRVMGFQMIYQGTVCSASIKVNEVFVPAIRNLASAFVVGHNHPSGDATPSPDDIETTRTLIKAGKLLEIQVQDHLIFGDNKWTSLKERGLGFS